MNDRQSSPAFNPYGVVYRTSHSIRLSLTPFAVRCRPWTNASHVQTDNGRLSSLASAWCLRPKDRGRARAFDPTRLPKPIRVFAALQDRFVERSLSCPTLRRRVLVDGRSTGCQEVRPSFVHS